MILNFVLWCLFGLVAGAVAKFLMPGRDPAGFAITIVLGIVGASVGGFLSSRLLGWDVTGFNLSSMVVAVGGGARTVAALSNARARGNRGRAFRDPALMGRRG